MRTSLSLGSTYALLALAGAPLAAQITVGPLPPGIHDPIRPTTGPVPRFVDVGAEAGVDLLGFGRGSAMVDFDQDGLLDLFVTNTGFPDVFYRQKPDRSFEDVTAQWGVAPEFKSSWGVLATDFDNDGDDDVYIFSGGFNGMEENRLLRNDLNVSGMFVDISTSSGDANINTAAFGGCALDYDLDGDLDIYVSNSAGHTSGDAPGVLLRNDGGLMFTDVSVAAGIIHPAAAKHAMAGDLNNDGWPEIVAGTSRLSNLVYLNNGDGTFSQVAGSAGLATPADSFGVMLDDFDNDGWLDVYLPRYQIYPNGPSMLFLNNGDMTFRDVTPGNMTGQTDMGHTTADFDDDGFPDVFIGTGWPREAQWDVLYRITPDGKGGLRAEDISRISGILAGGTTRCHGSPVGDYDQDGDLDMYANNGGVFMNQGTAGVNFLWQNQGTRNHWVGIDLVGTISNRPGVGAHLKATTVWGTEVHRYRQVGRGFCNTDAPTVRFGLGNEEFIESIVVDWPSGVRQMLFQPEADMNHTMVETGLWMEGHLQVGATVKVNLCGEAFHEVFMMAGDAPAWVVMPDYGGVMQVGGNIVASQFLSLDADGHAEVLATIPNDPAASGMTFYVQAWVHPPGTTTGGLLTNLLELAIP